MNLNLTEEQELLRDSLKRLLGQASSPDQVRAAEPEGFDPDLWAELVAFGAPGLRVAAENGGSELGLFEAVLVAEEAGRRLAAAPLIEAMVANRILSQRPSPEAADHLSRALTGELVVGFLPRQVRGGEALLLAAGAIAHAVVALRGDELVLLRAPQGVQPTPNLAALPLAAWPADAEVICILATGEAARALFSAAREEWKLLMAAALFGLADEALGFAARYAGERIQFGRPIGSFQGISHPLADAVTANDGGRWLVWDAVSAIAKGSPDAGALAAMAYAWAARTAAYATQRAIHTFGGYGLALSSDVQLYFRRAKGWPLLAGDPAQGFLEVGDRLWRDDRPALPEAGETRIDFSFGPDAEAFRDTLRAFFEEHLDEELLAHADRTWDGYHPRFQKILAEHNLLFPTWPAEYGGQNRDPHDFVVMTDEYFNAGWTVIPVGVTRLVSESLLRFGSEELKAEVLPKVTRGEVVFCLGYTEPGSGSDVGAASTRAAPDGPDWLINGQKMFNSGANIAHYVFLLTRTDSETSKHRGLTMFLVPLDTPGIEVFPFDTLSNERSNATYFTNVRVPDRYRVGEVNGGWAVIRYALGLEHAASYWRPSEQMVDRAVAWAKRPGPDGKPPMDEALVRSRLALAATRTRVSWLILQRALWAQKHGGTGAEGPMSKLFSAEAFLQDASDLVDLTAPWSLLDNGRTDRGRDERGLESHYRHAIASINYGGTSEIMRSLVGQSRLGLPRDR